MIGTTRPGTLLDALDGRDRRERALSRDGGTWLTVGELLDRALAARADIPAGGRPSAVPVPSDDPVAAISSILAAQAAAAVPVVGALPATGTGGGRLLDRAAAAVGGNAEPLLVVVTSGTAGRPRAVVRTVASWQLSLAGFDAVLGPPAGPGTVVWAPGTPSSTLTLFALWHGLATGRPVLAPGRWRPGRAASAAGGGASSVQCVPTVLADLLDARAAGRFPRLRRAVVAGAAVTDRLRRRCLALDVGLAEYYGAAELSFVAADPDGAGLRAFPGAELSLRDGVVWVRSPYLSLGYLEPEPSAALHWDRGGWATVGDLGAISDGGVLTVRGRGDGTATVGGTTVTLADVELALADVDGVAEVVALAEPDARFGERVFAVIRAERPAPATAGVPDLGVPDLGVPDLVAELRSAARHLLPAAARPVRYVVRPDLPRVGGGGKVARAALLAELAADRARTLTS